MRIGQAVVLLLFVKGEKMTKEEIKEEIIELYGANQALIEAMNQLHKQQMETTKKMFALNNMLREMEDKND